VKPWPNTTLANGKEDNKAAIAVRDRDKVFFHGEFPRQG